MRLIDADGLKEWITAHCDIELEPVIEKLVLRVIDDQPTACSKDEASDKLARYEDMEDAGRLKIFPCAIGDTIWIPLKNMGRFTGEIVEDKIQMIGFTSKGIRIKARKHHAHNITLKLGESVFLTRKSAEAALKECEQE